MSGWKPAPRRSRRPRPFAFIADRASLIDLPHLAAVDIQRGEPTARAAAGIESLEVTQVEDFARILRRVSDDGDLA